jgi:transposase InsO family protein
MTDTVRVALRRWQITVPDRIVSGIGFRTMSAARSSIWRWRSRSSRRGRLAVRFTDEEKYFVSEASVYRLLTAHDLITSPAYIVIKAANEFKDKTTAINQLWQTDFTYLKITGWGWYYLSTVLDDFSRYIVAWKLCATMCALRLAKRVRLGKACWRTQFPDSGTHFPDSNNAYAWLKFLQLLAEPLVTPELSSAH